MDLTLAQLGGIVALVGAAVAVVGWVIRKGLPFLRKMGHFFDDWFGEAARPGVDARPGVPAQLATLRQEQVHVAAELKFNGGESVKDVTNQTRAAVSRLAGDLDKISAKVDTLAAAIGGKAVIDQASQLAAHEEGAHLWQTISDVAATSPHEE